MSMGVGYVSDIRTKFRLCLTHSLFRFGFIYSGFGNSCLKPLLVIVKQSNYWYSTKVKTKAEKKSCVNLIIFEEKEAHIVYKKKHL